MDWKQDKQQTITRLVICVVIAAVLYVALDKVGDKFPALDPYRPWLEKNKIQAIAIVAAILFGVSLAVLPLEDKKDDCPSPDPDPCDGYERACDLP